MAALTTWIYVSQVQLLLRVPELFGHGLLIFHYSMVSLLGAYAFRPRASSIGSFDHLVGTGEQRGRHIDVECLGGLQVDNELERSWLHYR